MADAPPTDRSRTDHGPEGRVSRTAPHVDGPPRERSPDGGLPGNPLPGNKDRTTSIQELVNKVDAALMQGIHVMIVDLFPPRKFDPQGLHGEVWARYGMRVRRPSRSALDRLLVSGRRAGQAYIEHMAFGDPLPGCPVPGRRDVIYVPLELSYQAAFQDLPVFCAMCSRGGVRRRDGSRWLWFYEGNR